jgi:predicted nucleic acid-binding protein
VPIVSNSSPLIALARIQRLDLVPAILQSILIPPAVAREIEPSIPALPAWLSVKVPFQPTATAHVSGRLGDGEREAIALAIEIGADAVLMDERAGRRVAEEAGLKVIGTLGLLLKPSGRATLQPFSANSTSSSKRRSSSARSSTISCCAWPVNTYPERGSMRKALKMLVE